MLPTSSGVPDNKNCMQNKNHFHLISRKLNTDELNFLIKIIPDKKAKSLKIIDLFIYLNIKQELKILDKFSVRASQEISAVTEDPQLPVCFSGSCECFQCFQLIAIFYISCTKVING